MEESAPNAPAVVRPVHRRVWNPQVERRYPPIHVLSCDSRFPHLQPEQQLEQGSHFLLLFECDPQEAREAALEAGAGDAAADLVFAECARRRVQKAKAVTADRDVTWAPYLIHQSRRAALRRVSFIGGARGCGEVAVWFYETRKQRHLPRTSRAPRSRDVGARATPRGLQPPGGARRVADDGVARRETADAGWATGP